MAFLASGVEIPLEMRGQFLLPRRFEKTTQSP